MMNPSLERVKKLAKKLGKKKKKKASAAQAVSPLSPFIQEDLFPAHDTIFTPMRITRSYAAKEEEKRGVESQGSKLCWHLDNASILDLRDTIHNCLPEGTEDCSLLDFLEALCKVRRYEH